MSPTNRFPIRITSSRMAPMSPSFAGHPTHGPALRRFVGMTSLMNADGTGQTRLTTNPAIDEGPISK
jgi:hypothetical protein